MRLRFHLVLSDVDLQNEDFMCKRVGTKMFFRVPRDGRFSLDLLQDGKKGCALKVGCEVCGICGSRQKIFLTLSFEFAASHEKSCL